MPDTRATWSNRTFEALFGAAYNFGVEHRGVSKPVARALFDTDVDLVYAGMDEVREMPDGSAILDVPCGGGITLSRLRSTQRVRYVAADISVTMLDRARRRASEHGVRGVEFVEADIERMPFDDAEFDLCACFNGLHCLPDPAAAVRELARCLTPGGRLIGECITNGVRRRTDAYASLFRAAGVWGKSGTPADLENWLTGAGLRVDRLELSGAIAHFAATKPA